LFSHHPELRQAVGRSYETILRLANVEKLPVGAAETLQRRVADDIAPFNSAGLCDPGRKNIYPFV
jgi:hypothetical protein